MPSLSVTPDSPQPERLTRMYAWKTPKAMSTPGQDSNVELSELSKLPIELLNDDDDSNCPDSYSSRNVATPLVDKSHQRKHDGTPEVTDLGAKTTNRIMSI